MPELTRDKMRESLLACFTRLARKEVTELLPELAQATGGAPLFVEELSGAARAQWLQENDRDKTNHDSNVRLVIASLCYADGVRVFSPRDREALLTATALVMKLVTLALSLNGFSWREEDALKNGRAPAPSSAPPPAGE